MTAQNWIFLAAQPGIEAGLSDRPEARPKILAGNTLKHKFTERVKFQKGFTFYQNVTTRGEYRYVFDSTLSADVTKRIGWFVTVADRYSSLTLAGIEKNDFLFATGLKVGFGKTK